MLLYCKSPSPRINLTGVYIRKINKPDRPPALAVLALVGFIVSMIVLFMCGCATGGEKRCQLREQKNADTIRNLWSQLKQCEGRLELCDSIVTRSKKPNPEGDDK